MCPGEEPRPPDRHRVIFGERGRVASARQDLPDIADASPMGFLDALSELDDFPSSMPPLDGEHDMLALRDAACLPRSGQHWRSSIGCDHSELGKRPPKVREGEQVSRNRTDVLWLDSFAYCSRRGALSVLW